MKNIRPLHMVLILLVALSSCTEPIDLKLNESNPRMAVEGSITTDSIFQSIKLTSSTSYYYSETPPGISDAIVEVSDGSETFGFTESTSEAGLYISDKAFAGKIAKEYQLKISHVDIDKDESFESYNATELMKSPLIIDSLYAVEDNFFGKKFYRIYGYGQEPPTQGDFYMWRYYLNGELLTDTLGEITFNSDELINGQYLTNLELGVLPQGKPGDTLTLETSAITEDYFNYIISFMIETRWNSGGFGGPPANIKTNIDNGALGYFNTASRTYKSVILP